MSGKVVASCASRLCREVREDRILRGGHYSDVDYLRALCHNHYLGAWDRQGRLRRIPTWEN